MIADQIERFILDLNCKTQEGELKWKVLAQFTECDRIKKEIEKSSKVNLKNFFIDDERSYCLNKGDGYVIVLYVRYSKAPIFSPALDKRFLLVKINDDFPLENLSAYSGEDGYGGLLLELAETIDVQIQEKYSTLEYLHEFFVRMLGED